MVEPPPQAFEVDGGIAQYIDQRLRHGGKKIEGKKMLLPMPLRRKTSDSKEHIHPPVGDEEFASYLSGSALVFTDEKAQVQGRRCVAQGHSVC